MDAADRRLDRSKCSSRLTVEGAKCTRTMILLNKVIVVPGECHWHLDLLCKQRSAPFERPSAQLMTDKVWFTVPAMQDL